MIKRKGVLQKQINTHINSNPDLPTLNRQLQSVRGVGSQVACLLMASMPELSQ